MQRAADIDSGRSEKRIGKAAADDEHVDFLKERFEHRQLGGHLGARHDGDERSRRILQRPLERVELADEQRTCAGDRRELCYAVRARLRAMRRAEGIHHEHIAECRHLAREKITVLLLAGIEAHVLAEERTAGCTVDAREPVFAQRNRLTEKIRQTHGNGRKGELLIIDALRRPSEVREDEYLGALIDRVADRGQCSANARIARHLARLHRHIQILADQYAFATQVGIRHAQNVHAALDQASVVSSMRLEKPHSLSYQAHTLTSTPSMHLVSVASKMDECGS